MRLFGALFVAATLSAATGCSLNPFADDAETPPAPVSRQDTGSTSGPVSLEPDSARQQAAPVAPRTEPMPPAREVPLAAGAPERYVVKKGDTLWDISAMFLRDPWFWPEIWQINPQVENPHLIYPGDILSLVYIDGQPRILLERGLRAERLSPQIRSTPLDQAITSIPYEQIAAFLTRGAVLEKDQLNELPYIMASKGDHLIAGAGNDVYVRGGVEGQESRYSVLHVDEPLVDPDDDRVVGYQALYVGEGQVQRLGDPATVHLLKTSREALAGDRLIRQEIEIPLNFFPKPPDTPIDGRI
ncbi:MAG: LysM peptidoglycan-binding domain-containing protein, partial [Gammaproteobacteria bacterium]